MAPENQNLCCHVMNERSFVFSHTSGILLHILPSSHFSNLRIDVIASEGDLVVSYDEKTLILWDMKAGVQKASFTADKVRKFVAFSSSPMNAVTH